MRGNANFKVYCTVMFWKNLIQVLLGHAHINAKFERISSILQIQYLRQFIGIEIIFQGCFKSIIVCF